MSCSRFAVLVYTARIYLCYSSSSFSNPVLLFVYHL